MDTTTSPDWLSEDELETWHALNLLIARLPAVLGEQLQRDSSLSLVEYYVLAGLSDQPDRTIRMSTLAALANSELSRLSHLVRRLERRGLVRREPDPTDGRFTHAILTDEGLAHLEGAAPGHERTSDSSCSTSSTHSSSTPCGRWRGRSSTTSANAASHRCLARRAW